MTQDEIRAILASLEGAHLLIGSAEAGTPESAHGHTFCTYAPDGDPGRRLPFATIVTSDTPGWDEASDLDRPGAFRVNLAVGRELVPDLGPDVDHTQRDVLLPHPQHAAQGWVCVVDPGPATAEQVRALIAHAHRRAQERHAPGAAT